jgi:antitoxin (DNA-binding transcriptional repressor) of toxin-antitoxin stability system
VTVSAVGGEAMKKLSLAQASRPLAEYATRLGGDVVVITQGNRPLAALVPLRRAARETSSLWSNPRFRRLIGRARRQIAQGKSVSLEEARTLLLGKRRASGRNGSAARK